jgi:uncharacterized protein YfdQ (DUF2303 family)
VAEKTAINVQPKFTDEALQAGILLGSPHEVSGYFPFALVPNDAQAISLEKFRMPIKPDHRKAAALLTEPKSFVEYVNTFGGDNTVLWVDPSRSLFGATLDYHESGADGNANWRDHTASLQLRHTKEWALWISKNKNNFTQVDFAEFLESNLADIVHPDGAELLQAATTLSTKRDVNFSSSTRLQDGTTQFTYEETTSEKGTVKLPEQFILGLAPYEGMQPYKVEARLRYRLNSSKLTFFYDLLRTQKVLDQAIIEVITAIEDGTKRTIYRGSL